VATPQPKLQYTRIKETKVKKKKRKYGERGNGKECKIFTLVVFNCVAWIYSPTLIVSNHSSSTASLFRLLGVVYYTSRHLKYNRAVIQRLPTFLPVFM